MSLLNCAPYSAAALAESRSIASSIRRTCLGGYTLKKTTDTARSRPVNYYTLTMEEKPNAGN